MPVVPFLPVIAAGIGGAASIYGASKAAGAVGDAAAQNNALQKWLYEQNQGNFTPFMQAGQQGQSALQALLGLGGDPSAFTKGFDNYKDSMGYKFTLDQGVDALNTNAANRNLLRSGSNLKDISAFGQKTAQSYLGSYLDRLQQQQQVGLAGASALAGAGQSYGAQTAANNNMAADASANAWLLGSSAFGKTLGAMGSAWPGGGGGSAAPASAMRDWRVSSYGG